MSVPHLDEFRSQSHNRQLPGASFWRPMPGASMPVYCTVMFRQHTHSFSVFDAGRLRMVRRYALSIVGSGAFCGPQKPLGLDYASWNTITFSVSINRELAANERRLSN